jgi:hypothetical protein
LRLTSQQFIGRGNKNDFGMLSSRLCDFGSAAVISTEFHSPNEKNIFSRTKLSEITLPTEYQRIIISPSQLSTAMSKSPFITTQFPSTIFNNDTPRQMGQCQRQLQELQNRSRPTDSMDESDLNKWHFHFHDVRHELRCVSQRQLKCPVTHPSQKADCFKLAYSNLRKMSPESIWNARQTAGDGQSTKISGHWYHMQPAIKRKKA